MVDPAAPGGSVFEGTTSEPDARAGYIPHDCLAEVLRLIAAAAAQRGGAPNDAATGHDAEPGAPRYPEAAQLITQVMLACMASGFRYWGRAVETWGKALPRVVEALTDSTSRTNGDSETAARLLDSLRTFLRELAELPAEEFRRLQADLERIAPDARSASSRQRQPDASPYWRRWHVKP